jgi:adenylate kinase
MRLVFLGAPGVGKGTQSERLCADRKLPHVSTGDMLREAKKKGTPVGLEAKKYMDGGQLVPDEVVLKIVAERLADLKSGFVFDGFPRTVAQAKAFDASLKDLRWSLDAVVYFEAPEDVLVERLSGRRVCEKCAHIFHVKFSPPNSPNTCDHCGGPLVQRVDDAEASVRERLKVYERSTTPLIGYYANRGLLVRIEAQGDPDAVYERLTEELE